MPRFDRAPLVTILSMTGAVGPKAVHDGDVRTVGICHPVSGAHPFDESCCGPVGDSHASPECSLDARRRSVLRSVDDRDHPDHPVALVLHADIRVATGFVEGERERLSERHRAEGE